MKIAIMQPYFFPYIGYWQLIRAVDKFVVYDNIEFTKKSWIRRNRILLNGSDRMITLPIKNDSDYLNIRDRYLSDDFEKESHKILNQIMMSYCHAPEFNKVFPKIEDIMSYESHNLFDFIYNSILKVAEYLELQTEFVVSSNLTMNHNLRSAEKVLETCRQIHATEYINPIGGLNLYDKDEFKRHNIDLAFIESNVKPYPQFNHEFIPSLSIIDVMMFNDIITIKKILKDYTLI